MFQPKAPKCSKNCSLPQNLASLLLPKPVKLVNKTWSKDLEQIQHSKKMPNKELHKETIIDQCKNKMHEDKRSISFEEEDKSVVV